MSRPLKSDTLQRIAQVRELRASGLKYWQIAHRLKITVGRVAYLVHNYIKPTEG